jgi:hypothetical protein
MLQTPLDVLAKPRLYYPAPEPLLGNYALTNIFTLNGANESMYDGDAERLLVKKSAADI